MTGMPIAPESFVSVCQALYGDLIDPDEVWEDVAKRSPDQADLHVDRNAKIRRNVERGSNAVGITAGTLGTIAAVKDPRFAEGGRWQKKLAEATKDIPSPLGRHGGKVGAALATGALGTQVLNLGGDFLIGGTLSAQPKRARKLKPTGEVDKAFRLPSINMANLPKLDDVVAGSRKAMRGIVDSTKAKAASLKTTGPAPGTPAGQSEINTRLYQRTEVQAGHPRNMKAAAGRDRGVKRWGDASYHATRVLGTPGGKVAAGGGALVLTGAGIHEGRKANANAVYVDPYDSYTAKSFDFEATGTISKIDEDKHLVFGWLSVSKINGAAVVDKQNDYIDPADLEEAAYAYVHGSRVGGDMHGRGEDGSPRKVSDLVESMVFTPEKIEKMGLPSDFPIGWWGGFKVHDEAAWEDVKKGRRTGFSVHGKGRRTDVDLDELMGA